MDILRSVGGRMETTREERFEQAGVCQEMINRLREVNPASLSSIATFIGQFAETNPDAVVKILLLNLQREEVAMRHRLNMYCALERAVKDAAQLNSGKPIISMASEDMRRTDQDVSYDLQLAASDTLVTLSHHYFNDVMYELQGHLEPLKLPHPFILITLANLASTNVFRTVPFLVTTLVTMQSMLGLATTIHMKETFCTALESFSEAIGYYLMNKHRGPYLGLNKANFSIGYSYSIITDTWLHCRESKVKTAAIKAIGPMTRLLPDEKLVKALQTMIPVILKHYGENMEAIFVTKTLQDLIGTAADEKRHVLEKQKKAIFTALLSQIMVPSGNIMDQNYRKVLDCFLALANHFPDSLLSFAESKSKTGKEGLLLGTLNLILETIKVDLSEIRNKMNLVLKVIKLTLRSNSALVKMTILRVIYEMANHGYLNGRHGFAMVEYVVQQCAMSTKSLLHQTQPKLQSASQDQEIREMCINLLEHLTATVTSMTDVLWPRMLSFVILPDYTTILTPLCKSITQLALRKQQEGPDADQLDYRGKDHVPPSPCSLLARLLVISSSPNEGGGRGIAALQLLNTLQSNIHPEVGPLWNQEIPALVEYLKASRDLLLSAQAGHDKPDTALNVKEWARKLLQFLGKTLACINQSACVSLLSTEFCAQMGHYGGKSFEKYFLYKSIGLTLTMCADKEEVKRQLKAILQRANFVEELEREGIASMVGLCAESHLILILHFMDKFKDSIEEEHDTGLLSYLQNLQTRKAEKVMSALMMAFGSIAVHADRQLLLTRVELEMTNKVLQLYQNRYQDLTFTVSFMKSISLICTAIQNSGHVRVFHFSRKLDLICLMLELIHAEPEKSLASPVRYRAMTVLKDLSKLKPSLTNEEINDVVDISVKSIFSLPPLEMLMSDGETPADAERIKMLYGLSMQSLGNLLISFLQESFCPEQLKNIFDHTEMWIVSENKWERERAIEVSSHLLTFYSKTFMPSEPAKFPNLGYLIALFAPHTSDSTDSIRKYSLECIYSLGCLQRIYQGNLRDPKEPHDMRLSATASDITKYVSKYLQVDDFIDFANTIFDSILSKDVTWAAAAAVWLKTMAEQMAPRLQDQVSEIIGLIYMQLHMVKIAEVRRIVLHTLRALAHHHQDAVMGSLLMKQIPFDNDTIDLWRSLASEPSLSLKVLRSLMDIVNQENSLASSSSFSLQDDQPEAALEPLKATCAIHEVVKAVSSPAVVQELYPELFCTLLAEISRTVGHTLVTATFSTRRRGFQGATPFGIPNPCSLTVKALQCLLSYGKSQKASEKLMDDKEGWSLIKSVERHHEGVMQITRGLIAFEGVVTKDVIFRLLPSLSSPSMPWRVTGTAFFVELMGHKVLRGLKLLKDLIKDMKEKSLDHNCTIRSMAVRALGNVSAGSPDKIKKYKQDILEALLQAVSHTEDIRVIKEGFRGLANTVEHLQNKDLGSHFHNLAMQCKSYMDDMDVELRANAIKLFGYLAKEATVNPIGVFAAQVVKCMPILLLRLKDPSIEVSKACEFTLRCCMPFLASEGLQSAVKKHTTIVGSQLEEFLVEVSVSLVHDFPELLPEIVAYSLLHFQIHWETDEIRCAATLLIGYTVESMGKQDLKKLDLKLLFRSLHALRKDSSVAVQQGALKALRAIMKAVLSH